MALSREGHNHAIVSTRTALQDQVAGLGMGTQGSDQPSVRSCTQGRGGSSGKSGHRARSSSWNRVSLGRVVVTGVLTIGLRLACVAW